MCAKALMTATFVPGISCKWCAAVTPGVRTSGITRGSTTISLAPLRIAFFIREAKTGWAEVGLAPINMMTSLCSTDSKS